MKNNNEIWKDVKGFENQYQVSNLGRVRSKDRYVIFKDNRKRFYKSEIKNLIYNKKRGYLYVNFKVGTLIKNFAVHRLVAENFLIITDNTLVVDHIDKNKLNNVLTNLRLVTNRYNLSRNSIDEKGYVGVCWHKRNNKWMASIYVNGKIKHIGYYNDLEEAKKQYLNHLSNA